MACETVRAALLERSLTDLEDLRPHLDQCPTCAALLATLREAEAAIGTSVDAFANSGDFSAALAAALEPEPIPTPSRWSWLTMSTLAAAVALTVLAVVPAVQTPEETRVLAPVPRIDPAPAPAPAVAPVVVPAAQSPVSVPAPVVGPEPAVVPEPPVPEPTFSASVAVEVHPPCDPIDFATMEPLALKGALGPDQNGCLEVAYRADGADRREISTLLITDAWARKDTGAWDRLVSRHLTEVDPADPELAYKYALFLSRQGAERAEDVIAWTDEAIAHASVWKADVRTVRIETLHKLRATASLSAWMAAEQRGDRAEAERYHALTKAHAEAWYGIASRGKNAALARDVCENAGGNCQK